MIRQPLLLAALAGAMLACFAIALHMGPTRIDIAGALADNLAGRDSLGATILWEIRLPRSLLALVVGASLAWPAPRCRGCCATRSRSRAW